MRRETLSVSSLLGQGYERGFFSNCKARYRVFKGGRNTKKSVDILGYEPVFRILSNPYANVVMVRKVESDHRHSTIPNLRQCIENMGLSRFFKFRNQPREIIYLPTGQKILFKGMNNPTGFTSLKADVGVYCAVYFEEASELDDYEAFRQIDGSVRIGREESLRYGLTDDDISFTFCLNPWDQNHWIYDVFFKDRFEDDLPLMETRPYVDAFFPDFNLGKGRGLYLHVGNYKINEFRSDEYDRSMRELKEKSYEMYKVEALGAWGNSHDSAYPEFKPSLSMPLQSLLERRYKRFAIGIDFGVSDGQGRAVHGSYGSATTMCLVAVTDDDQSALVCLDEYFWSNEGVPDHERKTGPLIQAELIQTIRHWMDDKYRHHPDLLKGPIPVYVDCADSGGFRDGLALEARRQGVSSYRLSFIPSTKLPIRSRIDFSRLLMAYGDCLFSDRAPNLVREIRNCKTSKNRPRQDGDDHAINAWEYAWASLRPLVKRFKDFKERK